MSWPAGRHGQKHVPESSFLRAGRNEIAVVRHHYFLSAQDRTPGRLDPFEIAGSLMSNLQRRYPAAVGELGSRNHDLNDLEKWLSASANHFNAQGKALVVILDGLDHVWREQASIDGLNRLFERLLPVKPGLIVLVGTQPIEEARLPLRLLREAPTRTWRWLPRLDVAAVRRWVEHHQAECALPEDENYRSEIIQGLADTFYGKSEGHPLLLRYALRQLRESGVRVTAENVSRLSGEPHRDVGHYYAELQTRLSANGRMILHLLAACRFPWPESGITNALAPQAQPADVGAIQTGIREVRFLLEETPWGLRAFHGSLLVFIGEQKEYAEQSERLRRATLEWLRGSAPRGLTLGTSVVARIRVGQRRAPADRPVARLGGRGDGDASFSRAGVGNPRKGGVGQPGTRRPGPLVRVGPAPGRPLLRSAKWLRGI